MVYTDILEHCVIGDTRAPLLRSIALDNNAYAYSGWSVKNFSSPLHLPLLKTNFKTIEIDIKDHQGKNIPFDIGTLTVTLHFKKIH